MKSPYLCFFLDSLVSGIIGAASGAKQSRKNREFQRDMTYKGWEREDLLREDQRRYVEEMYNKYESPSALREQYQSAGISPALAFGGSPQTIDYGAVGFDTNAPEASGSSAGEHLMASGLQQIGDSIITALQARNLLADAKGKEIKNEYARPIYEMELTTSETMNALTASKTLTEESERKLKDSMTSLNKANERLSTLQGDVSESTKQDVILKAQLENNRLLAEIDNIIMQTGLSEEKTRESIALQSKIRSEIKLNSLTGALYAAQKDFLENHQTELVKKMTDYYESQGQSIRQATKEAKAKYDAAIRNNSYEYTAGLAYYLYSQESFRAAHQQSEYNWDKWERGFKIGMDVFEASLDAVSVYMTGGLLRTGRYTGNPAPGQTFDKHTGRYFNSPFELPGEYSTFR